MKKIPCLFVRTFRDDRSFTLTSVVTPGCEWVVNGEGLATRKWDGTSVMVRSGAVYARYDAKRGKQPPAGAIPCTAEPDPVTGHWPHWVLANRPEDRYIREAFAATVSAMGGHVPDGTYEACGPKIGGNPERLATHVLMRHGDTVLACPRDFRGLEQWMAGANMEGVVFHHSDGRMAKIRRSDFGLPWPVPRTP